MVINNVYTREFRLAVVLSSIEAFESDLRAIFVHSELERFVIRDRGCRVCTCLFSIRLDKDKCREIILSLRGYETDAMLKLFLEHIADDIDLVVFGSPREDFSVAA